MSYSFNFSATTKNEACIEAAARMEQVAREQTCHKFDVTQAIGVAQTMIMLLPDDSTRDVHVSMHGSLSGNWVGSDLLDISGVAVSVSAYLVNRV